MTCGLLRSKLTLQTIHRNAGTSIAGSVLKMLLRALIVELLQNGHLVEHLLKLGITSYYALFF